MRNPIGDDHGCHRSDGTLRWAALLEARSGAAGLDRTCDLRRHSRIESRQQPKMGFHRCTQSRSKAENPRSACAAIQGDGSGSVNDGRVTNRMIAGAMHLAETLSEVPAIY